METILINRLEDGNFKMKNGKILTPAEFDKLEALMPEATFIILSYHGAPKSQSKDMKNRVDFRK